MIQAIKGLIFLCLKGGGHGRNMLEKVQLILIAGKAPIL